LLGNTIFFRRDLNLLSASLALSLSEWYVIWTFQEDWLS
jgi:hypothetical protein